MIRWLFLFAACGDPIVTAGEWRVDTKPVQAADRKVLGEAAPYTPIAPPHWAREAAWRVVAQLTEQVPLAEPRVAGGIPRFRTWYGRDDVQRMFKKAYADLGKDGRKQRAPLSLDGLFAWNTHAMDALPNWPLSRYDAYVAALDSPERIAGIAGVPRVTYNQTAVRHLLEHYSVLTGCEAAPADAADGSPCSGGELPIGSVVLKMDWRRAELGITMPAYDATTFPDTWGDGDQQVDPREEEIYTIELPNTNRFRLAGMHIAVKEQRHWVWLTLAWSRQADADNPLTGAWGHYRMCMASSFADMCSNPYLEHGAGNGQTNCIGCHQYAGTTLTSEQVLLKPDHGREQERTNFPADYVWSLYSSSKDADVFRDEMQYYDAAHE